MRDLIEKLQKITEAEGQECKWWAMCDNPATTTEPHPILGDVPICDRCVAKLRKIEGLDENYEEERSYDDFVDYYVQDLSSSIVRKGVFQDLYKAAGNDIDVLNAAIKDEAYSIADSYYGTGEGIGTSDMNHFIQGIGKQLGVDDLFGWYKKKESVEESDEDGINTPELFDREGYHLNVRKAKFMPSEMLDGRVVLHDLENISPGSGNPKIITFDDLTLAKEAAKKFDGIVIRTDMGTYRIVPNRMKSADEMERDKTNRYAKYNAAIRRNQGLEEDSGHSIFEILADSDVYHLVDDLEYGRFDNNSSYADILYDYYNDEMPYDVATGDYGEPDEWIKDKLMQDYGDEIDDIAQKMASEQLAAIRKNAGLSEADDGADVATAWGGPYEDYENYQGKKVKIRSTMSGEHEGEVGTVVNASKYRDENGGWQAEFDVKLDSGETIKMYPGEWAYDQLDLVTDPYGDFMLDNPFEGIDEEIDPAWGGAVEEWMEYRREGFRDARDGVYRPEAYAGKAKEAYKLGKEDWVSQMAQESVQEGIVKVPRGLRYDDVVSNQDFGMTSDDAEAFVNSLGPDDTVSHEVVDPETGELLDWPDRETRRKRNQKEYDRQEKERKEREEKDHEEGYDSPYLYVSGLDKDPENAWEGIQTLKYDREFTDFYNIVWRSVREYAGEPEDLGADTQDWADLDYDVDIDIPVAIKRKDGKKFNKQDRQNFDWISKIFKAATGNIGVHYIGSSDNGTVARFNPTFM